jgi:peptidoglycan/LPS O-acetylase OafA/YrhL
MLAIAFPVTYCLAFLSWRLVERPALALKRLVAPRQPEPAPVVLVGAPKPSS